MILLDESGTFYYAGSSCTDHGSIVPVILFPAQLFKLPLFGVYAEIVVFDKKFGTLLLKNRNYS